MQRKIQAIESPRNPADRSKTFKQINTHGFSGPTVTPDSKAESSSSPIANLSDYQWRSQCRDLYRLPTAA
jgi:hypothetical protein